MTQLELDVILNLEPKDAVSSLQVSSYDLPSWDDLEEQYDPLQHSIWDETKYPANLNTDNQDDFKRTALGLQKLACDRLAQSMFSDDVERVYDYDTNSVSQEQASRILEKLYRNDNNIDAENINRAKKLNASCQVLTVWSVYDKINYVDTIEAKMKLTHRTYSPMDGYDIYPQIDDLGNLLVVSVYYTDTSNVEHLEVFTNSEYRKYDNMGEWTLNADVSKPISFMPCAVISADAPAWGGLHNTVLVEQLEEMESYQGMYIKKNAMPIFTMDYGDTTNGAQSTTGDTPNHSRKVIKLGKGGVMQDLTWQGATEAVTSRYMRIRNSFFEQTQTPDNSFATMLASNTSADNKDLLFADVKAKAIDAGGEWVKFFSDELEIVKQFAKVLFPSFANDFDLISIRSIIRPYSVKSSKDDAELVALAGSSMSLATRVRVLDLVDDIQQEVATIEAENLANTNQL